MIGRYTGRLSSALYFAYGAFCYRWMHYDELREREANILAEHRKRNDALAARLEVLNESDKHFLQSFFNSLGDAMPERNHVERFFAVLEQLPAETRVELVKRASALNKRLITTPAMQKWAQKNSRIVAQAVRVAPELEAQAI